MKVPILALVVPCYNEEDSLPGTSKKLEAILKKLIVQKILSPSSYILYVNDGSSDRTWDIIRHLCSENKNHRGICFSRNFGHQSALLAGLLNCKDDADCVISIDADLQQDENMIPTFVQKYLEGYDIVNGVRSNRDTDSLFKKFSALFFYSLTRAMGVPIIKNAADYRLLSKRVILEIAKFPEVNLFLRGLIPTLGFKTTTVTHTVIKRKLGKSTYSLKKMLNFAWDGITSFSIFPIRLVTIIGLLIFLFSCIMGLYVIYMSLTRQTTAGWASTVLPIYFLGGIQIFSIGLVGEYIGKAYMETKQRPRYIIQETFP